MKKEFIPEDNDVKSMLDLVVKLHDYQIDLLKEKIASLETQIRQLLWVQRGRD